MQLTSLSQLCEFLKYRNDIYLHFGEHYCRRSCEGAIFLCGNSYYNDHGDVTKCGHIAFSNSQVYHQCSGSSDLYFTSADSRSASVPQINNRRRRRNRNNKSRPHFVDFGILTTSGLDCSGAWCPDDELDIATDFYYYNRY